uniref:BTB domain-containing protein n=1 Tax=Catharus ustulatus TaxID=91951 RepID=A0A8C3UWU5_CATUS
MAPVVEVSDAGHCRALLLELNEQRLRGQFCDVTIIAEDTKFRAHKNVLAASSPFFKRALAQEPTCPSPAQVLELPDRPRRRCCCVTARWSRARSRSRWSRWWTGRCCTCAACASAPT